MHISKLKIKNFKCFDEVEIIFDPNFNLIIGENNSGKSTIFDGLRLWQLAFQKFLKDRTNNQQSSFYASQFYSFTIDDISFLRILDFKNLFNNNSKKEFEISLTISNGDSEVILPIIFLKTTKELLNKIIESDTKLVSLMSQNETIKKELDFNKKLGFAIILLVIITIIVSLL